MEKNNGWKITAIILGSLLLCTWGMIAWGTYLLAVDERRLNECYYDVCSGYEDAEVLGKVCACYSYDLTGQLFLDKTEILE